MSPSTHAGTTLRWLAARQPRATEVLQPPSRQTRKTRRFGPDPSSLYRNVLKQDATEEQVVRSGKAFGWIVAVASMTIAPLLVLRSGNHVQMSADDRRSWQGARREHTRRYVTDEQRSPGAARAARYQHDLRNGTLACYPRVPEQATPLKPRRSSQGLSTRRAGTPAIRPHSRSSHDR